MPYNLLSNPPTRITDVIENVKGSTGVAMFDTDTGVLMVLIEDDQGYDYQAIDETIRKDAELPSAQLFTLVPGGKPIVQD